MALQELRKASTSKIASVLILLLALSFLMWGVNDAFLGGSSRGVAKVGNQWVSAAEYSQRYGIALDQLNRGAREPLTTEQIEAMGIKDSVLNQLIDWTALDIMGARLGLDVHDDSLKQLIRGMDSFKGIDGEFDTTTYSSRLAEAGYTPASFEAEMRHEIIRAQLKNAIMNGAYTPRGLIEDLILYRGELRQVSYLVLDESLAGGIPAPDEAALKAYIDAHSEKYMRPELRTFAAILFRPADFAGAVEVTEDEIKQSYDFDIEKYRVPEKRELRAIAFTDDKSAKAAFDALKSGKKAFEALGKERGYSDADLAFKLQTKPDVGDAKVADAVFAAAAPGLLEPVNGDLAWTLAELKSVTPGTTRPLAEVHDEIKAKLALDRAQDKIDEVVNQYLDGRAGGETDEELAKRLGLKLVMFNAVDREGKDIDGVAPSQPIPESAQLLEAAFAAEQGVQNDPEFLKDGGDYVIRLDQVDPPAVKEFAKIADAARKDYSADERMKRLTAKARELVQKFQKVGLGAAATEIGKTPIALPSPLRRDDPSDLFSTQVLTDLFMAPQGGLVSGASADGKSMIVASVLAIAPPSTQERAQGVAALADRLDQALGADLMTQYVIAARESLGVRVDRTALDAAASGGR